MSEYVVIIQRTDGTPQRVVGPFVTESEALHWAVNYYHLNEDMYTIMPLWPTTSRKGG